MDHRLGGDDGFDVTGLDGLDAQPAEYAKAAQGAIADFSGVSAPYEVPLAPALAAKTGSESVARRY